MKKKQSIWKSFHDKPIEYRGGVKLLHKKLCISPSWILDSRRLRNDETLDPTTLQRKVY